MKSIGRAVLVAAAALLPLEGGAQEASAILSRAAQRYEALSGFCADFRQTVNATQLRRTVNSAGEFCQRSTHLFEMRFTDPAGDRIVADGSYIWFYYRSIHPDQISRTRVASGAARFDLHQEFLSNPGEKYTSVLRGRETAGGRESFVLELTPRDRNSDYRSARVWIDTSDYLIRKVEIHEISENIRTMEFIAIRLNPTVPDSRFRLDPPPGVQVITQ